jgi:hypothetical protein
LDTGTSLPVSSLRASLANSLHPPGTKEISRSSFGNLLSTDTLGVVEEVAAVASQASTVVRVEGLAEWIRLSTSTVPPESSVSAPLANVSVPASAEEIRGSTVVNNNGVTHTLSTAKTVSNVA